MGMRSSWVAWQEPSLHEVVGGIGLAVASEVQLMEPGLHAFPRGDHQLLVANGFDFMDQISDLLARDLSTASQTYFWTANDTTMTGAMSAYRHGACIWSVVYPGERRDPVVTGEVPAVYHTLLAEQRAAQDREQDAVDHIYDVLHRLGATLVGFRHDEFEPPAGCAPYLELRPSDDELPISHLNADAHFELTATGHWERFEIEVRALQPGRVTVRRIDLDEEGGIANLIEHATVELAAEQHWHCEDASGAPAFVLMASYPVDGDEKKLLLRVDRA